VDEQLETNRLAWDECAALHARGCAYYPVEAFKAGQTGLRPNTPDDLGDVRGQRLLHLQCHFGMDSLMWVRQGAVVTGVDFSPVAIAQARRLATESGLEATFLEADVCQLPDQLRAQFDMVLSYCGTITWLGNLKDWARGIARCLKPGGFFYLADCHPLSLAMEVSADQSVPQPHYSYFGRGQPIRCDEPGTYALPQAKTEHNVTYQWQHTIQDILSALIAAGLQLEFLHEFPFAFYQRYSHPDRKLMRQDEQGWWHLIDGDQLIPLILSLKAVKTA
jgi:SAM-dependent methyltransferase